MKLICINNDKVKNILTINQTYTLLKEYNDKYKLAEHPDFNFFKYRFKKLDIQLLNQINIL